MKHRFTAAFVCAVAFAAAPAFADSPTVRVHIDASSQVVLERIDGDGNVSPACRATCDVALDAGALYRTTSAGMRRSAPFRLQPHGDHVVLTPKLARSSSYRSGLVLTTISGVFLTAAVFSIVGIGIGMAHGESFGLVGAPEILGVLAGIAGTTSLATGIPGIFAIVSNARSSVIQTSDVRVSARTPTWSPPPETRLPSVMSVPLLSGTF